MSGCLIVCVLLMAAGPDPGSGEGTPLTLAKRRGTAVEEYNDARTNVRVRVLTQDAPRAQVIYQTHPMWTAGMEYFLFDAEAGGQWRLHARQMKTGQVQPLLDGPVSACALDPKGGRLYYVRDNVLYGSSVSRMFRGAGEPEAVAPLPKEVKGLSGGLSVDAQGGAVFAGVALDKEGVWALMSLDLASSTWRRVAEVDFQVGHVQANPAAATMLMFCHETGGDAPQRTWVVNVDGTGLRPFYRETYGEWVTHEVWWGGARALFTIWPYDDEHKQEPYGAAGADLDTGALHIYARFLAWHIHGSPDGKWIVADDMERNLWLIRADTGERRLLVEGYPLNAFKTHPHPSFTPDSQTVVFTCSRTGMEGVHMAFLPPWEYLPPP